MIRSGAFICKTSGSWSQGLVGVIMGSLERAYEAEGIMEIELGMVPCNGIGYGLDLQEAIEMLENQLGAGCPYTDCQDAAVPVFCLHKAVGADYAISAGLSARFISLSQLKGMQLPVCD